MIFVDFLFFFQVGDQIFALEFISILKLTRKAVLADYQLQEIVMLAILSPPPMRHTRSTEYLARVLTMRFPFSSSFILCPLFFPVVGLLIIRKVHRLPCYAHLCFFSQKYLQRP